MDNQIINSYLNNFRRFLGKYLKPGVGMTTTTYPHPEGAVIVLKLGFGISTQSELKGESESLAEALTKTTLFEGKPNNSKTNIGTSIILSKNKIILIKDNDQNQWNEDSARKDVNRVVKPKISHWDGNKT